MDGLLLSFHLVTFPGVTDRFAVRGCRAFLLYACEVYYDDTGNSEKEGGGHGGRRRKDVMCKIKIGRHHDELYFRDYLNGHPALAEEYEKLKLSLWKKYEHDRDAYTDAKSAFVKKYTDLAKTEYRGGY